MNISVEELSEILETMEDEPLWASVWTNRMTCGQVIGMASTLKSMMEAYRVNLTSELARAVAHERGELRQLRKEVVEMDRGQVITKHDKNLENYIAAVSVDMDPSELRDFSDSLLTYGVTLTCTLNDFSESEIAQILEEVESLVESPDGSLE